MSWTSLECKIKERERKEGLENEKHRAAVVYISCVEGEGVRE